jgi:predicted ester cyclase
MGAPPTGRTVAIKAIAIYRFENGRVAEMWDAWDVHALMDDLGFLPAKSTGAPT